MIIDPKMENLIRIFTGKQMEIIKQPAYPLTRVIRNTLWLFISALFLFSETKAQQYSYFKDGNIHVLSSSHQDIAWMDSPDACIQFRDEYMITPALERMKESKDYCFSVEDALSLREYLERHPEKYREIWEYTREGRLEWGATSNQPYQSMYDGEALVRQMYFGKKWLQKMLPGCDFRTAWNLDVPGMALQFPQILAKSGTPYYLFSRHQPGFYQWFSPDGSFVLGWSPGQYDNSGRPVRNAKTEEARTDTFSMMLNDWSEYYQARKMSPEFIFLNSFDFSLPVNYDTYMEDWNRQKDSKGLPRIRYATGTKAMDLLAGNKKTRFDELQGERPNIWLYIHGPAHHRAIQAGRDASRILTTVEKFSAFNALLENSFGNYPSRLLSEAWQAAIYPDHGWGGKNGHITDRLFSEKFGYARDLGEKMLRESLTSITRKINYKTQYLRAITVFNPLSWERTDPVTFTFDAEGRSHNRLRIVDASGKEIPCQLTDQHEYRENSDEVISFRFVAENIPSMGYKTYYLAEGEPPMHVSILPAGPVFENQYYRMVLGKGGLVSLYDKELQKELFQTGKFLGGELFTMHSEGNGAGEFTDIQQPTMEGFDQLQNYRQNWQWMETGPVCDIFQLIQPFQNTKVYMRIILYKTTKRIDLEVDLNQFDGENWREFRLAFPVNMEKAKVAYEVPMGVIEVGKSEMDGSPGFSKTGQIYSTPCKEIHPREVQDWFSVSDGTTGLTISSDVAVFDWIDPTSEPVDYPVLQPVLLASRKSCHREGNYYLQPGNHTFRFSIYSHRGDWKNGFKSGTQSKQKLQVILSDPRRYPGYLPEQYCFVSTETPGVMITTVKKCEDDDTVILRCNDMTGEDRMVTFRLFDEIGSVFKTNMIEESEKEIDASLNAFTYKIGHHAIETFKIVSP